MSTIKQHSVYSSGSSFGTAVFDGTAVNANWVSIGHYDTSTIGHQSMTWCGWCCSAGQVPQTQALLSMYYVHPDYGIEIACTKGDGTMPIRLLLQDIESVKSSVMMQFGKWYHIAGVFDQSKSSGNVQLYIDGALAAQSTQAKWLAQSADLSFSIGGRENSSSPDSFYGKIANVNVWDRALSASEVAQLATSPLCRPSDASHQWLMDHGFTDSGTSAQKWHITNVGSNVSFAREEALRDSES